MFYWKNKHCFFPPDLMYYSIAHNERMKYDNVLRVCVRVCVCVCVCVCIEKGKLFPIQANQEERNMKKVSVFPHKQVYVCSYNMYNVYEMTANVLEINIFICFTSNT